MIVRRDTAQIIIHYTDTRCDQDFDVHNVREWHLQRGFHEIGYHYLIKLDGTIQRGRDILLQGAHCKGQNHNSIGVAYVGGQEMNGKHGDTRTPAQMEAIELLIQSIRIVYGNIPVFGHNDYSKKYCPGYNAQEEHADNNS